MILEQETLDKYGYKPGELSKGSHKIVIVSCDFCGLVFNKQKRRVVSERSSCIQKAKIACKKCKCLKSVESSFIKYGCHSINSVKDKIEEYNIKKYGYKRPFCSPEFLSKVNAQPKIRLIGKNNPRWRHDLTKKEREENQNRGLSPKNRKWVIKVLKRDNYTCQCCGDNKGGNLEAHHVHSYHSHTKLRYVTSNGITLCKNCHKEFHKEFGYTNNNRKQFNKFLKEHISCKTNYTE